ncbi:MAG TPA: N-acetyltransferase [Opitutaceae bacterium]|nr:N-acetyltransferase [Opitutaceae bacterium]
MSDSGTQIRPLTPEDAAAYGELRRNSLAEAPHLVGPRAEREARDELTALRARIAAYPGEGVAVFGGFRGGICAAAGALARNADPKFAHKLFLWGMYVRPEFRGQSLGREMLERLLAFARRQPGAECVMLQATTTNEPAKALYRKFGFVSCGIEPKALKLGDDYWDFETMQLDLAKSDLPPAPPG